MDGIGFGAAYYAEYQRQPDLRADFDLMAQAAFTVIQVGESVWSPWEPEDGRFERTGSNRPSTPPASGRSG
jgi:beta-galactosidase